MEKKCEEWVPFGTTLALITKKYFGALGQSLKQLELDRNYSVLLLLDNENRSVSQQFIADYLLIDKTQMVRIMDYLTKEGMITKELNALNRREYLVSLTPKAKKVIPVIKSSIDQINERMFADVTDKNKKDLYKILCKISTNLDGENQLTMSMNLKPVKTKK